MINDSLETLESVYEEIAESMRDDFPKECADVTAIKVADIHRQISGNSPRKTSIVNEEIVRRLRNHLNMPEPYDIGGV